MVDKNHIIDEIVRTAKQNNGVALGVQRFEKETGIRKPDWFPAFWKNWSEAIEEAGFAPNKMNSAYEANVLIHHIILLIRELKKLPTTSDFKFKSYHTSGFPSHNTFRRLGAKSTQAAKILAYCNGKSEYDDVIEICSAALNPLKTKDSSSSKVAVIKFGFVYLMKSGRYYKIGKSDDPERRKYELGINQPEDPIIIHKIQTDDPFGVESYWKKRFKSKNIIGRRAEEFFDLSSDDVIAFKRWRRLF